MFFAIFLFTTLFYLLPITANCTETKYAVLNITGIGQISGTRSTVDGKQVDAFLGIPFAKPPTGSLRFAAPVYTDLTSLREKKNFTKFKPMCPQLVYGTKIIIGSEDCLYLNLYTPVKNSSSSDALFPIMVWIHGGSYVGGSASQYDGSILAAKNEIIIVTVNSRLGVLGFFNLPKGNIKGNYGFLDQLAALRWVKEHIIYFGGNSDKVALAGVSSGASSVSLLSISPLSQGLFSSAISMSGTAFCHWAVTSKKADYSEAKLFGESIGCNDMKKLETCLRSKSWREIIQKQVSNYNKIVSLRQPVTDGFVIPDNPTKLTTNLKANTGKKRSLMLGYTANEGTPFVPQKTTSEAVFKQIVSSNLKIFYGTSQAVQDAVMYEFSHWQSVGVSSPWFDSSAEFISDRFFTKCTIDFAEAWAKSGGETYLYEFSYLPTKLNHPSWKVAHALDVAYLFGQPFQPRGNNVGGGYYTPVTYLQSNFTNRDKNMSFEVMKIYGNFVKYGNLGGNYSSFISTDQRYIDIDFPLPKMKQTPRAKRMAFWNIYVPKLLNATRSECLTLRSSGQQLTLPTSFIFYMLISIGHFPLM